MGTTIITKNGSGAPLASDLVAGELAVDLTNKRLYSEDSGGTVIEVGSNPSTIVVAGTSTLTGNVTASNDVSVGGNLTVTGNATIEGNLTFGNAATDTITLTADVASNIVPSADDTYDLGATVSRWRDIYIDGTAYLDAINFNGTAITATAAELNILDGVTSTAAELNLVDGSSAGTVVNSKAVVYGASGEVNATTLQIAGTSITSTAAELNILDGKAFLDEDDMSSDSATGIASQQSIKAYVDSQVSANNELSEVLSNGNTTGATNIVVTAGQSITTDSILETTAAAGVDIDGVLLKDTSVGTDDASGTDVAGTAVTVKGGAGTGTGAGGSLVFQTAPAGTTGSSANAQVTALTIDSAGDATFTGASYNMSWDKSADSLIFADNAKAVFGAGSDLQIYHDGLNSYIVDSGTGDLYLRSASNLYIGNAAGTQSYITAADGGAVDLRFNGSAKLATTSTGIDVTGTVTADGLTVDGNVAVASDLPSITLTDNNNSSSRADIEYNFGYLSIDADANNVDAAEAVDLKIGGNTHFRLATGGDISFYEDTGTTAKLFWDASAESLGIGTTTPSGIFEATGGRVYVRGSTENFTLGVGRGGQTSNYFLGTTASSSPDLLFSNNSGTTSVVFTHGGNVGIGTSSPASQVHLISANPEIRLQSSGASTTGEYSILSRDGSDVAHKTNIKNDTSSLTFGTGGNSGNSYVPTERMRIDSSGNVGIGTASPSSYSSASELVVDTGVGGGITVVSDSTTGGYGSLFFADGTTGNQQYRGYVQYNHNNGGSVDELLFGTAGSEAMRIDSSGNVGIGMASPSSLQAGAENLVVGSGSGDEGMTIYSGTANRGNIYFADGTTGSEPYRGQINYFHDSDYLRFVTAAAERMRIDSSGNLLVGKSSSSFTTAGVELAQGGIAGKVQIQRSTSPLTLVNLTDDGNILNFYKGTGAVGSIGADYTGTSAAGLFIGNGTNGLFFNGSADIIQPYSITGGENVDNTIDLGNSAKRFKDLYLSGGVYVGGAVAANKLDDYEEGTWTPTVAGDATGAFSTAEGTYTKVGRLVFIEMYVVVSTNFTSNYIGGLPFTVGNLLTGTSLAQSAVVLTNAADTVTGSALESSGNMRFFDDHNTASFHNPNTTNGGYRLSLCYQV
jgi:hypothetical protein